jgi:hypothetical protein
MMCVCVYKYMYIYICTHIGVWVYICTYGWMDESSTMKPTKKLLKKKGGRVIKKE